MKKTHQYIIAIFLISFIFCPVHNLFSQDRSIIDSLLQVLENSKQDTNKVNMLTNLAWEYRRLNSDTALIFCEEALKLSKKISFKKGVFESYSKMGVVYYNKGSYNDAIEYYNKALELANEIKNTNNIVKCNINIGLVRGKQGNFDEAIENYATGIKISEETNYKFGIAKCSQNIGIIYYNQGFYDKAIQYYQRANKIWEELKNKSEMATCHFLIGQVYKKRNSYELAHDQFLKGLKLSESIDNKHMAANCYIDIGNIYINQGYFKKANENYFKALELNEKINNKQGIAVCFMNIGIVYEQLGSYDNAIKYYHKSVAISEKINNKRSAIMVYANIGALYINQENYDLAIEYINKSLKIQQERNDKAGMELNYSNLGLVYSKKGFYKQANECYFKSLEINKEFNNKFGLAQSYQNICSLSIILSDSVAVNKEQRLAYLYKAVEAGEKSIKYAREIKSIFEENDAAELLMDAYVKLGNYKKAMEYADIYIATQDSMFNKEKTDALQEMQTKYETEKKNGEIKELKIKDIENQNAKKIFQLVIIFLFVISVLLIFFFRQKHKSNKILNLKNYQLNKLTETQSRLMSIISHDLKAPLSAFFSITSSLKSKINTLDSTTIDEYFNRMLNSALAVKLQLENLLVWSITQSTEINVHKSNYNLTIIAQKVIIILEEFSKEKSITLINNINESIQIKTDGRLLSIVLNNLITNAIKFSDNNSKVEISALKNAEKTILTVKDSGCGISQENIKTLFVGQNSMKHVNKGTGLGLIVCKDIIEKLGGKISAESELGKGTTFLIEIHE